MLFWIFAYGEVSVDSDYTSDPMEDNKVRVERAKRQKAKVPCLQPLVLTRRQQAIATTQCKRQPRYLMHCTLVGAE